MSFWQSQLFLGGGTPPPPGIECDGPEPDSDA